MLYICSISGQSVTTQQFFRLKGNEYYLYLDTHTNVFACGDGNTIKN